MLWLISERCSTDAFRLAGRSGGVNHVSQVVGPLSSCRLLSASCAIVSQSASIRITCAACFSDAGKPAGEIPFESSSTGARNRQHELDSLVRISRVDGE